MAQRGWVGWIEQNRAAAGVVALALVIALVGIGVVVARSGDDESDVASGDPALVTETTVGGHAPGLPGEPGDPGDTQPGTEPGAGTATPGVTSGGVRGGATATTAGAVATTQAAAATCTPKKGYSTTGVTETEVTVGQIVSDVNFLPAQLKPNHEGLQAYLKLVNDAGGVCGRKIRLIYSNDNSNPATHEYESMTHRVFAFVANSSLIDSTDYESEPPFNPRFKDNNEFVPDVGGLAYSYGRNQSPMFAGNIGSLSPVLTGGAAPKLMIDRARAAGKPCRKGAILYLREPTGASEDQGQIGKLALEEGWGGNLGRGNTKFYVANLADPIPVYEAYVTQMIQDGMNCAFTYMDLGSNINLVRALVNRGVWPPDQCNLGDRCFNLVYMPFAGYDPKFIRDAGDGAKSVITFLPHIPLNETGAPVMQKYLNALKAISGAEPSTFSIIGYTAGQMFVDALRTCGDAPTRSCLMGNLRKLQNFTADGLLAGASPFKTTRVTCGDCGRFTWKGTFDWKWIFNCFVMLQINDQGGQRDFRRVAPAQGYACDSLRAARGTPA